MSKRLAAAGFVVFVLGACVAPSESDLFFVRGNTLPAGSVNTQPLPTVLSSSFPGCSEPAQAAAWRNAVIELVNQERLARGLNVVAHDPTLEAMATQYACELIQYEFFDHVNPVTGSTLADRAQEFQYDFLVVGENLAAGQASPEAAFEDWMNSPSHRQNILDPRFTHLGVAIRIGGEYATYWVQEFGRPLNR